MIFNLAQAKWKSRLDKHVKVANAYPYSTLSVILFFMPLTALSQMYYMLPIAWYIVLRNNSSYIWKGFNLYSKVASAIKQACGETQLPT